MNKRAVELLLGCIFLLLVGCGKAHVRINTLPPDLAVLRQVRIGEVLVASPEEAAKTNMPLQEKLKRWEALANIELRSSLSRTGTQVADPQAPADPQMLVLSLRSEVRYGNRALRYWVGFGAGKGGVHTVLVATDPKTGEARFQAVSDSELAVGGGGGDIDNVYRANLEKLFKEYERAMKKPT